MWFLITLCFSMTSCDVRAEPKALMGFYTQEACETYGRAVVAERDFVFFCADGRSLIVED